MELSPVGTIFIAIALLSLSGVPALFGSRFSMTGQRCAALMMAAGGALGLWGTAQIALAGEADSIDWEWALPAGRFAVSIDALSAVFLVPVFVVPALGSFYGLGFWKQAAHPANGRKLGLFYGLLAGSMGMVAIARDGVLFLISWEIMALAAFFAATTEDDDPAVRRAGWIYLIATHVGTLCLIAMFGLVKKATGSFALAPMANGAASPAILAAIFVLALIGFGFKAGLMPLHVWLPDAHANAPSHVSATMSGVMLKMGVYGIVRISGLLSAPPVWFGGTLLTLGAASGILGIAFAIAQADLKRALAYSSIENIGIVMMGAGLAMLGRSLGRGEWIALGLGGALFHVWNHSLFKSLLFLNAGAIIHATHTRRIDRLGGLAGRMPRTAALFLIGAVAICALPPLNGFAGEWLLYLGFLKTIGSSSDAAYPAAALGAAALAMIGALAAACFVKLYGGIFLGQSRSDATRAAHEPGASLLVPMTALAIGCVVLGLAPWFAAPMLDQAAAAWSGPHLKPTPILALAPMGWIGIFGLALIGGSAAIGLILQFALKRRSVAGAGTWDCGYARPTARMQYTGSSFGDSITAMFAWALRPNEQAPEIEELFPATSTCERSAPDAVLERVVLPVFQFAGRRLLWLRLFQQGINQIYIAYFLAAVLALLFWGRYGY